MSQAGHLRLQASSLAVVLAAALGVWVAAGASARDSRPAVSPEGGCAPPGVGAPLLATTVVNDAADLALPSRMVIHDRWLVVLDGASDSVLHLIRRADGSLYQSLGRHGKGPREFYAAWALSTGNEEGTISVFDVGLQRVTSIRMPGPSAPNARIGRSVQLVSGGFPTGAAWLGRGRMLTPGFYANIRLEVFDSTGRRTGAIGTNMLAPSPDVPAVAGQSRMAVHPDRRSVVLADRYASAIELVDLEKGTVRRIQGPVGLNGVATVPQTNQLAYVDVAVTSRQIVTLFSGRDYSDVGPAASFGRCLQMFAWDGTFLAAYRLDSDVLAIAVTDDEDAVYALRHDPVPAIVRFDLPVGAISLAGEHGPQRIREQRLLVEHPRR